MRQPHTRIVLERAIGVRLLPNQGEVLDARAHEEATSSLVLAEQALDPVARGLDRGGHDVARASSLTLADATPPDVVSDDLTPNMSEKTTLATVVAADPSLTSYSSRYASPRTAVAPGRRGHSSHPSRRSS
jgi:hypothetical protein